jgi:hypothetical protein
LLLIHQTEFSDANKSTPPSRNASVIPFTSLPS